MSHPKIPKNCPMFFEVKGDKKGRDGLWFSPFPADHNPKNWSHDSDFPMKLSIGAAWCDGFRQIIAAVAEVAWMKEAEKLQEKSDGDFWVTSDAKVDAWGFAKEWRAWGEMK